jgi:hypothetical protein
MPGRIVAITVAYADGSPDDPTLIDLAQMQAHCRAERVDDLIEDLTLLCQDVQAGWQPEGSGPVLSVIRGSK